MAEEFISPVRKIIEGNKEEPFFAYLHFVQPHAPYAPPSPFAGRFSSWYEGPLQKFDMFNPNFLNPKKITPEGVQYIKDRYDENLYYAHFYIQKIVKLLKDSQELEKTILIITADHGEAFMEHGGFGHSSTLYDEEIRIPLIIWFPKKYELPGKKINALVQSVDLLPSILDIYNIQKKPYDLEGKSLWPLLVGKKENLNQFILGGCGDSKFKHELRAYYLRDNKFKLILFKNDKLLFNLSSDPAEKNNLFFQSPVVAGYFTQHLRRMKRELKRKESLITGVKIDEKMEKQLKALGYIN